jgi:hypothetical protein
MTTIPTVDREMGDGKEVGYCELVYEVQHGLLLRIEYLGLGHGNSAQR